VEERR